MIGYYFFFLYFFQTSLFYVFFSPSFEDKLPTFFLFYFFLLRKFEQCIYWTHKNECSFIWERKKEIFISYITISLRISGMRTFYLFTFRLMSLSLLFWQCCALWFSLFLPVDLINLQGILDWILYLIYNNRLHSSSLSDLFLVLLSYCWSSSSYRVCITKPQD